MARATILLGASKLRVWRHERSDEVTRRSCKKHRSHHIESRRSKRRGWPLAADGSARENGSGGFSDLTVLFSRSSGAARSLVFCAVLVVEYCCAAMRNRLPYSRIYYWDRGTTDRPWVVHRNGGPRSSAWPADERARGVSAVRSCGDDCRAQVYLKWTPSKKLVAPEARGRQQASCLTPAGKCLRRRKTDAGRMRIAEVHSLRPFLFSGDGFG